ncbi:MAG: helix-turn-helix domain-containing protein [Victivallales bacterium]
MKKSMQEVTGTEKSMTRLFSIGMLMNHMAISRPTANRLVYGGFLRTVRVGRGLRIPESSIVEFIEKGGQRHIQDPKAKAT